MPTEGRRSRSRTAREAGEVLPTGEPASALQIRAINYVLVQVNDLRKAEQFYQDFSRCGSWAACGAVPTGPGAAAA